MHSSTLLLFTSTKEEIICFKICHFKLFNFETMYNLLILMYVPISMIVHFFFLKRKIRIT